MGPQMMSSSSVGAGVSLVVLEEEGLLVVVVFKVVSPPAVAVEDVEVDLDADDDEVLLWLCPGTVALEVAVGLAGL